MKCKKCEVDFEPSPGLKNFCSWICRNGREQTDEINSARRESMRLRWTNLSPEEKQLHSDKRKSKFHPPERLEKLRAARKIKRDSKSWDEIGYDTKRYRVLEEQRYCCNRCGFKEWLNKPLTLEIDHIDGNNRNNLRENLEGLCPNCHSLTPTWRGRNKPSKNGENKVSDEDLSIALKMTPNIRQALLMVGLAAKGNNYVRAKKLKDQF